MAVERKWLAVTATPLTANGTALGLIQVADTTGFKVKGQAFLIANTLSPIPVQIQRVLSPTLMIVGPPGTTPSPNNYIDVSAFTVALNAQIGFPEQDKNKIKPDDIEQAVYESDPAVAIRNILVDQYGNFYDKNNPMPTKIMDAVGLAPDDFDEVVIDRDAEEDPVSYNFFKNSNPVGVIQVTYDLSKVPIRYKRTS